MNKILYKTMVNAITYNLRLTSENSDGYYDEIATYAEFVHEFIERNYAWIISQYSSFLLNKTYEKERSRGEYCIEMLTLGMCWHKYSGAAHNTSKFVLTILDILNDKSGSTPNLKKKINTLRGFIIGSFVEPQIKKTHKSYQYTASNFHKLLFWMEATGEFTEEVKRLKNWLAFFLSLNEWKIDFILSSAAAIFDWFTISSHLALGKYTDNLPKFLKDHAKNYKYRDDIIFTGKDETEYHFNMVSAEILNNGSRAEFEKLNKRILLIPDCMKIDSAECGLQKNGDKNNCRDCKLNCRIAELINLESKKYFDVKIIPHSHNYSQLFEQLRVEQDTGLIVAACMLCIAPSAHAMQSLDIKAQCISLDYCGCKQHWHEKGIPTDLNKKQILKFLNQSLN